MSRQFKPPRLLAGPYPLPSWARTCDIGEAVGDLIRGEVTYAGISDSPIAWPWGRVRGRTRPIPVMTVELGRAIHLEAASAVVYHWGVSRKTVWRWRRALDVVSFNPGTAALWAQAAAKLHTPAARRQHLRAMRRLAMGRLSGLGPGGTMSECPPDLCELSTDELRAALLSALVGGPGSVH